MSNLVVNKEVTEQLKSSGTLFGMDLKGLTISKTRTKAGTHKLCLPWTINNEFLEDNPHGQGAETIIQKMMQVQIANDLADLVINGDTTSNDILLKGFDGLAKQKVNPQHAELQIYRPKLRVIEDHPGAFERDETHYILEFRARLDIKINEDDFNITVMRQTYTVD